MWAWNWKVQLMIFHAVLGFQRCTDIFHLYIFDNTYISRRLISVFLTNIKMLLPLLLLQGNII